MITLYTPIEEAFLHDYFELGRPDRLKEVDICAPAAAGVHVTRHGRGQLDIPHAVARLALSRIQKSLPQWAGSCGGDVLLGRDIHPHHVRKMELRPRHLFSINWADTAPGISWPEVYHLVLLPGFDRYVITASADSDDAYGVTDFALGWFPKDGDRVECVKEALIRFWRGGTYGWDQYRWEYVSWPGEISEETANRWADEAWPETAEHIDEEWADEDEDDDDDNE